METAVRGDSESDSFRFPSLMVAYSGLAPLIVTSKKVKISSFFLVLLSYNAWSEVCSAPVAQKETRLGYNK